MNLEQHNHNCETYCTRDERSSLVTAPEEWQSRMTGSLIPLERRPQSVEKVRDKESLSDFSTAVCNRTLYHFPPANSPDQKSPRTSRRQAMDRLQLRNPSSADEREQRGPNVATASSATNFLSTGADEQNDSSGPTIGCKTELGPYDVLLGRGSGPNEHKGNVRYRTLVLEAMKKAISGDWSSRTKQKVAKNIVADVKSQGGRFVRKSWDLSAKQRHDSTQDSPSSQGTFSAKSLIYEEVPDSVAFAKVRQSFRHQRNYLAPDVSGRVGQDWTQLMTRQNSSDACTETSRNSTWVLKNPRSSLMTRPTSIPFIGDNAVTNPNHGDVHPHIPSMIPADTFDHPGPTHGEPSALASAAGPKAIHSFLSGLLPGIAIPIPSFRHEGIINTGSDSLLGLPGEEEKLRQVFFLQRQVQQQEAEVQYLRRLLAEKPPQLSTVAERLRLVVQQQDPLPMEPDSTRIIPPAARLAQGNLLSIPQQRDGQFQRRESYFWHNNDRNINRDMEDASHQLLLTMLRNSQGKG